MAVGFVVGVGVVKGFDFVMRGFMGLPKGQRVHNGDDGWIPLHEAAFPKGGDDALAAEARPGETAHTTWPDASTPPSPGAAESTSLLREPEDRQ